MILLPLTVLLVMKMGDFVATTSCNPAILRLYGWCEQWNCTNSCTCTARSDCRQYCDIDLCKDMKCLSSSICKQKIHRNGEAEPHVLNMFARAPFITQDCSGGRCDVMRAKGPGKRSREQAMRKRGTEVEEKTSTLRPRNRIPSAALQNCLGGACQRIVSTLQISKQFCTLCTKMHCMGQNATNCTQVCAGGSCRQMVCDAKECQQACLRNSSCAMKCGKSAELCVQICEKGSNCKMHCNAKSCKQICGTEGGGKCEMFQSGKKLETVIPVNGNRTLSSGNETQTDQPVLSKMSTTFTTTEPVSLKPTEINNSITFQDHHTKQNSVEEKDSIYVVDVQDDEVNNGAEKLLSSSLIWVCFITGLILDRMATLL